MHAGEKHTYMRTTEGDKSTAVSGGPVPSKPLKQPSLKKDAPPVASSIAASDKKGGDRPPEKERKKDVPPPRMQFDDKSRVEKAKRRAVIIKTEARNRVELFRHLPQYEHGTQLPDLESRFFQLDPVHPAVYKVLHLRIYFFETLGVFSFRLSSL